MLMLLVCTLMSQLKENNDEVNKDKHFDLWIDFWHGKVLPKFTRATNKTDKACHWEK